MVYRLQSTASPRRALAKSADEGAPPSHESHAEAQAAETLAKSMPDDRRQTIHR
jgi:hypothetical protein